ncbi:hypothetical protein B0H17DRAFT_1190693 [Mycena rosella]|uniref:Uncharacterized protein n=1 Tax=Mycena rosella TaxID=1033263 RepID=A0AAD7MBF1_MYCRO|nr:hypothetical protein B0H17DRAFT_1190693 [Mycena rosella]
MGGKHGDIYGPYARHTGDTPDDIKALFRHAVDADILVEIGATIVPTLWFDINEISKTLEAHRLGRYGITSFYCSNYISAVHPDFDFGRRDIKRDSKKSKGKKVFVGGCYPCVQLEQTGTDKSQHEWDFAMVKWDIVIETRANTVLQWSA